MGLITDIKEVASHNTERKYATAENPEQKLYTATPDEPKPAAPAPGQPATSAAPAPKITKQEADETGESIAYSISSSVEMIRSVVLLVKHTKSLTPEEKLILENANIKESKDLTEVDIRVMHKHLKASNKYKEKKEKIPTSEENQEMLAKGFSSWSASTGIKASPHFIAGSVMVKFLASIALDAFLD